MSQVEDKNIEGWFVLWNVGHHIVPQEVEQALKEGGGHPSPKVYSPAYMATSVFDEQVSRLLYPGYLFVQGTWNGTWEQALRDNVDGNLQFLFDIDTKTPRTVPQEQMDVVFEQVRKLNEQEIVIASETLSVEDEVYILRRPWEHIVGRVKDMRKGFVFVEMLWGEDSKPMMVQVPANQVKKVMV